MNLYLVKRTGMIDHDEHRAMVVAAGNSYDAQAVAGDYAAELGYGEGLGAWWSPSVEVTFLGLAHVRINEPTVILADFFAG